MSISNVPNGQIQVFDIESKKDLLKRTICKGSSDEEFELFMMACKRTGLDPFMKQIYAVKRWSSSDKKEVMSMQTSIDGFRLIAERTGNYAPGRETTFCYDETKQLISATSYVKKRTHDGTWHEIGSSAYFEEYAQRTKDGNVTQFWKKMPHVMLAKCAESLALRKAFPADLSGIYTAEEMTQSDPVSEQKELTEEQCARIDSLMVQVQDEEYLDKLEKHLNVSSIYNIAPRDFERTIRSLEKRASSNQEKKGTLDGSASVA
jgi:hypothetical protein